MNRSNQDGMIDKKMLEKLNELKLKARVYSELVNNFREELRAVSSDDDFSHLIEKIVKQGKTLHEQLFNSSKEAVPYEVQENVFAVLEAEKSLSPFLKLLRYSQTFHKDFITTAERLRDAELLKKLPAKQLALVRQCIENIKSLKPTAEMLEEQGTRFRQRLNDCSSLDELEEIEAEIKILNQAMETIYNTMISFPKDEETAGIVIDYVEKSPHLYAIMKHFNVYTSLTDDILENTARLHEKMSLS